MERAEQMAPMEQARHENEFKQTENGLIPVDWRVQTLPEVCRFQTGAAHEPYISDVGQFVCVNSKFISSNGNFQKFCMKNITPAKSGDILMVMSDLPNGRALAKAFLVNEDRKYAVNQRVCALSPYRDSPKYLYYFLNRNPYFLKFDDGVNQTHLLNPVFKKCPVALPPTRAEQDAIADALSDADGHIAELVRLIEKKRLIKQGAMQELLSGRQRLPGFSGQWLRKKLTEVSDIRSGGTPSTINMSFWDGEIPWCTPTDISALGNRKYISETSRYISRSGLAQSSAELIPKNSIIMTSRATIGECAINTVPLATNQGFKNLIPRSDFNTEFLFYMMQTQKERLVGLCGGSTFLEIGKRELSKLEMIVPENLVEQEAIGEQLADMDSELEVLELRLEKARQIKQGMMQELLTGRVRLV